MVQRVVILEAGPLERWQRTSCGASSFTPGIITAGKFYGLAADAQITFT